MATRLGEVDRRLYALVLDAPAPLGTEELVRLSGLGRAAVDPAVRRLLDLGLLSWHAQGSGRLVAVAPDTARLRVLAPAVRELDSMQRELDRARLLYADMATVYRGSVLRSGQSGHLEALHGPDSVRETLGRLGAEARDEVLVSRPGGAQDRAAPQDLWTGEETVLERGVPVRVLYQHTARFNQRTVDRVARAARRGAEARSVSDDFMRLVVFDRRAAVLELQGAPDGALLVRDPSVVAFAHQAFERAWSRGTAFHPEYDHSVVEETTEQVKETIISLLVDGVEDKVIARRVGISLRTCQRHISEIMRRLGARNRLHAGYLLHRQAMARRNGAAG